MDYDPCAPQPLLLWDTDMSFDPETLRQYGDWSLDGISLQDDNMLASAVWLCLFTDRRAPDDQALPGDSDDPRGWWGDAVDVRGNLGETPLGSLMWLYERSSLTDNTRKGLEDAAYDSLECLVTQGMIADRFVSVVIDKTRGIADVRVTLYAQNRQKVFDAKFTRVWQQIFPEIAASL